MEDLRGENKLMVHRMVKSWQENDLQSDLKRLVAEQLSEREPRNVSATAEIRSDERELAEIG